MVKSKRYLSIGTSDDSEIDESYYANQKEREKAERDKSKKRLNNGIKSINKIRIPTFKPIRLEDENGKAFVKNFCVGLNLLNDDFVRNALSGNLIWKEVFDQDDHFTKKYKTKIASQLSYERDYLFQKDLDEIIDSNNNDIDNQSTTNHSIQNNRSNVDNSTLSSSSLSSIKQIHFSEDSMDTVQTEHSSLLSSTKKYASLSLKSTANYDLRKDLDLNNLNKIISAIKCLNSDQSNGVQYSEPIKCLDCSYTTTSIQNLILHSSYHRNYCDICKNQFKLVYNYYRHLGMHLKEATLNCSLKLDFRCTHCLVSFRNINRLFDHFNCYYTLFEEQTLFGEKTVRFRCKICNLVDVSYRSFQEHFSKNHMTIRCPFCQLCFYNLDQLEQHAFLDHKQFIHNYQCEFCHQKFTFNSAFENHLKLRHGIIIDDNKEKKCFLCDHSLSENNQAQILEHLADHCNIYLFKCDTCDFR